jgi:membrane protease YdiL (CAAX protease family)
LRWRIPQDENCQAAIQAHVSDAGLLQNRPLAPAWHTGCVLTLQGVFSGLLIYLRIGSTASRAGHIAAYSIVIAFEWALFALCLWHPGIAIGGHVGRAPWRPRSLLRDVSAALFLSALLLLATPVIVHILGPGGWDSTQGMVPKNGLESATWIMMSITAGICEETVFRGYLQAQVSGWTGLTGLGILVQAIAFSLSHAYQGWKPMALIFVWGCAFGAVAWWRKGLRANMIAHAAIDTLSAFG